jgi:outer membrane protein, heavy metal efflux system
MEEFQVSVKFICGFACAIVIFGSYALAAEPPARFSLAQVIEIAMGGHPALKAAAERMQGSAGLRLQAQLRPNPTISFQSENWRAWGDPSFDTSTDLDMFLFGSHTIEASGKRQGRIGMAELDSKILELEKQALEWAIRQDVRRAYLQALSAQKQLELLGRNGHYLDQMVAYHRARVEQGSIAEADLIRVQLERERAAVAQDAASLEAEQQRIQLLRAMGSAEAATDFRLEDVLLSNAPNLKLDLNPLLEQARANRISLRLARAAVDRARARVELEKVQAKPDWSVSVGYKRTMGFNTLLAGVSVPLPLLNRNEGNILLSRHEVQSAEALFQEANFYAASEIRTAVAAIRRRAEMLGAIKEGLLRHAEESYRISMAAYQEGGMDLLRLLDAQKVQNEAQLTFSRLEMEHMIGLAELETAVGIEGFLVQREAPNAKP